MTEKETKISETVLHEKFSKTLREADKELDLALIYINDGAFISGSKHLKAAAELFAEAQYIRNEALTGSRI